MQWPTILLFPILTLKKESNYIIYLDCNNLYGHSQSQYLPYGGFSFLKKNENGQFLNHENEIFYLNLCEAHDEIGYLLEVDLEYPAHLHDDHNDYPLAVEKCSVKKEGSLRLRIAPRGEIWNKIPRRAKINSKFPKERKICCLTTET